MACIYDVQVLEGREIDSHTCTRSVEDYWIIIIYNNPLSILLLLVPKETIIWNDGTENDFLSLIDDRYLLMVHAIPCPYLLLYYRTTQFQTDRIVNNHVR